MFKHCKQLLMSCNDSNVNKKVAWPTLHTTKMILNVLWSTGMLLFLIQVLLKCQYCYYLLILFIIRTNWVQCCVVLLFLFYFLLYRELTKVDDPGWPWQLPKCFTSYYETASSIILLQILTSLFFLFCFPAAKINSRLAFLCRDAWRVCKKETGSFFPPR